MWAISGTNGSSGLGSVSSEQMDRSTCSVHAHKGGNNAKHKPIVTNNSNYQ